MRTTVWYHPIHDLIILRWGHSYLRCWEGVEATNPESRRQLVKAMWRPKRYGWMKIGKFE